ncbi:MAG: MgtC/SapB family protein [Planctomycetes bacterium]|nr:MgtC/SapB family protein [Planctomycetota bacterium]
MTDYLETIGRLLLATACGAAIGWEREWSRKSAGLRTHMLVAVGAAAFMLGAVRFTESPPPGASGNLDLDPTRVIQGIVGGIGFLGAGAILHSRGSVKGLTTAAGIWLMGAVGVACGLGYYDLAIGTSVLGFVIIGFLGFLSDRIWDHREKEEHPE